MSINGGARIFKAGVTVCQNEGTHQIAMLFSPPKWSTPDYLSYKFIFRNDTTSYRLRNSEMRLALPQPRTDYVRKSFSYNGAALWNSLPTDIRVSKTLGDFKTKLSNFSFE